MKKTVVRVIKIGLVVVSVFAILTSVVILAGVSAGYLVNYFRPAIDVGSAAIIGVLAFGVAIHIVWQVLRFAIDVENHMRQHFEEDEDAEPDLLSDEQVETIADQLSEMLIMRLESWGSRRSTSSKHRR